MALELTSGPTTEPVSTAEAKVHLRVAAAFTADDTYIDGLVTAAREWCEEYTRRAFVTQTWKLYLDFFPNKDNPINNFLTDSIGGNGLRNNRLQNSIGNRSLGAHVNLNQNPDTITLPKPKVSAVTSVVYEDTDGNTQTLASGNYVLDSKTEPARLRPSFDEDWPDTQEVNNAVTVTFTAGYGDDTTVPERIKHSIKLLVGHWYENREEASKCGKAETIPWGVKPLLDSLRLVNIR